LQRCDLESAGVLKEESSIATNQVLELGLWGSVSKKEG
jgi:hypothetical protein